jgi:hypothetical protein
MSRFPRLLFLLLLAALVAGGGASAQTSMEDAIKSLTGDNGKGYIQPIADLYGANMNAGWSHSAEISRMGLHIEFDLVAMGGLVGDDQKTYKATAPTGFTPESFSTATIFGTQGTVVQSTAAPGISYRAPDGVFNTTLFPLFAPQLTLGNVYGTQASVRFLTIPKIGDGQVPEVTLWGVGVRHSVSQWLPMIPLDVAVSFNYGVTTVDLTDGGGRLFDYSGYAIGLQASKRFAILTVYGGLSTESSSMTVKYESTVPQAPGTIELDLEGANSFRATAGVSLGLGFFKLFADVNFGAVTHFSGGIGFGN